MNAPKKGQPTQDEREGGGAKRVKEVGCEETILKKNHTRLSTRKRHEIDQVNGTENERGGSMGRKEGKREEAKKKVRTLKGTPRE